MAKSFFSLVVFIGIGLVLITQGCQNYKIMKNNSQKSIMPVKELAAASLETPLWVEITGIPKTGSLVTNDKLRYLLLMDDESKTAIYVRLSENSSLEQQTGETTVAGMVSPVDLSTTIPTHESLPDVKIASLVLEENVSPPGKWSTYGLIILGFLFVTVPYRPKQKGEET